MEHAPYLRSVALGDGATDLDERAGYPFDLAAVRSVDRLEFGAVTVICGDNGSGKSTLVEAVAVAAGFNPEGGSRNLRFATHDTHSELADHLTLTWAARPRWGWFLRAESFYGLATHITLDDDPYAGLKHIFPDLHERSHGESFLALAESRFADAGLYLLDEPESALSLQGQMRLFAILSDAVAAGAQVIISTHSPFLMAFTGAVIYELDPANGIDRTDFEDLVSTQLWRRFFADPDAFLRRLAGP